MLSDLGAFIMTDVLMMIFPDSLFPCFSSVASYKLVELYALRYLYWLFMKDFQNK